MLKLKFMKELTKSQCKIQKRIKNYIKISNSFYKSTFQEDQIKAMKNIKNQTTQNLMGAQDRLKETLQVLKH